jgi:hypothetical protein
VNPRLVNLDGQAGCNAGIDHRGGMGHDATTLQVAEAVHKCTHRPLHGCGHSESDEAQSWAQDATVARIAPGATLEAQWHKWAAWWVGRSGCLSCDGVHGADKMNRFTRDGRRSSFTMVGVHRQKMSSIGDRWKLQVERRRVQLSRERIPNVEM